MTTPGRTEIRRFDRGTRWVHRSTAALFGICLATATILYIPDLMLLVGRRPLLVTIHYYSGLALPVPTLLGWLSKGFRQDTTELNRFSDADGAWLRAHLRFGAAREARLAALATPGAPKVGGKFNAGQKLYAAATAGSILVFLGTGLIMKFGQRLDIADQFRTGASFIHDLSAFAAFFAVAGHWWMASRDPVARRGMRTGRVPTWWAATEHPHWSALARAHSDNGHADAVRPSGSDDTGGRAPAEPDPPAPRVTRTTPDQADSPG